MAKKPSIDSARLGFLRQFNISEEDFASTGLDWAVLDQIRTEHAAEVSELSATAEYVFKRLSGLPAVHSLKIRVKDPDHLVAKVIRKKRKTPHVDITLENYRQQITDLIGIRAMHLFKAEWNPIHAFVTTTWELAEEPKAYVRKGDAAEVLKAFEGAGCRVEDHEFGYRSVHYLLKSQPARQVHITELQVRTVFEEGWSEIDHQVRYPVVTNAPLLEQFVTIFNRLAGTADEMGSFLKALSVHLNDQATHGAEREAKLKATIEALGISEKQKDQLRAEIAAVRRSVPSAKTTIGGTTIGGTTFSNASIPDYSIDYGGVSFSGGGISFGALMPRPVCSICKKPFGAELPANTISVFSSICPDCLTVSGSGTVIRSR